MPTKILVIDEGTTSIRAMLIGQDGTCLATAQRPLTQFYPAPGLVEHDAQEIWELTLVCAQEMVAKAGGADQIAGIGITNQRETIVFWDRRTGEPLAPAIVWQDRRTTDICQSLKDQGEEAVVQAKTGLLLDPYFSGSKMGWALSDWEQLRAAGPHLAVGTIESYLVFRLTGGQHISDATNASRTSLMAIGSAGWDDGLCDLFAVPRHILPEIVDCAGQFGKTRPELFGVPIAITGLAGDQQAATIGQGCLAPGQTKATFGTGAFVLTQTGRTLPQSKNRLLSTIAWQLNGVRHYALEGSIFVAGSLIKWLRDDIGLIGTALETEKLARSVPDNGGVYVVPALSGLGAPHWKPDARGAVLGLSFSSQKAHIVRAALEAMAHQTYDLKTAFAADGADWAELRIDGGMVANDWVAQDLSDMLDIRVERPDFIETTALGAAMLAGVGAGLYASLEDAMVMRGPKKHFEPGLEPSHRKARLTGWADAIGRVLA
ncbi:glycerol kinase [Candidatus Phycosocius spiralis]|uniref:Glycerol kinase n=1 Tax=Candidatus Phycosocius spiralis TaxID=2815099 RepID=A0ABQ4PTX5_9PROT|nr:glycerol kinase [Candidatus Phycosocius spiralis]GIU66467.1 glycerol kinase [Candidatus Phycosocius spiralis]